MSDFKKDEDLDKSYFPNGTRHQDVVFQLGDMHFVWDRAKSEKCFAERGFDLKQRQWFLMMKHVSTNPIQPIV